MSTNNINPEHHNHFFPISLDGGKVRLKVDTVRWYQLPKWLKSDLIHATENIAKIRTNIGKTAKVSNMPLVEVVDELWDEVDTMPMGISIPLKIDDALYYGARFPAQIALHKDEPTVRAVLVHEFAHCFYYMAELINHHNSKSGENVYTDRTLGQSYDDPTANDAQDRARMINPPDWFSEEDVKNFMYHDDPRSTPVNKNLKKFKNFLPTTALGREFQAHGMFIVEEDVQLHLRNLNLTP